MKRCLVTAVVLSIALTFAGCGVSLGGQTANNDSKEEAKESTIVKQGDFDAIAVGDDARDFSCRTSKDKQFVLSEHEGEVIFLNFWATWCTNCVKEMPALNQLNEEYQGKVTFLAVDCLEAKADVDKFIQTYGFKMEVGYDPSGKVCYTYPTEFIPYTVVIGKDGKVCDTFTGSEGNDQSYAEYKAAIDKALAQ